MFAMHKIKFKSNVMNFQDCLQTFRGPCITRVILLYLNGYLKKHQIMSFFKLV